MYNKNYFQKYSLLSKKWKSWKDEESERMRNLRNEYRKIFEPISYTGYLTGFASELEIFFEQFPAK